MTDDTTIRTITLQGRRYDESAAPLQAAIESDGMGRVYVSIAATRGKLRTYFDIDFADVEPLFVVMRSAAVEAGNRLLETIAHASASALIYNAQQGAARPRT